MNSLGVDALILLSDETAASGRLTESTQTHRVSPNNSVNLTKQTGGIQENFSVSKICFNEIYQPHERQNSQILLAVNNNTIIENHVSYIFARRRKKVCRRIV